MSSYDSSMYNQSINIRSFAIAESDHEGLTPSDLIGPRWITWLGIQYPENVAIHPATELLIHQHLVGRFAGRRSVDHGFEIFCDAHGETTAQAVADSIANVEGLLDFLKLPEGAVHHHRLFERGSDTNILESQS